jgi:transcriptional regulator with XRE-family HTH domain
MKARKMSGQLIAELRKIIGKSQTQFAAMIGVSKHTVISVENSRNQLSRNLAKRIEIATGAKLSEGRLTSPFQAEDYTRDDFNQWREKYHQTNEASARKQFDDMQPWLKVIFLAAAKSGQAGNRDRLPALCLSLGEWLNENSEKFKLFNEIEDVLEDETRCVGRSAHSISHLLNNRDEAKKTFVEHGIDFSKIKSQLKKHASSGWLIIEDEFRSFWAPVSGPVWTLCTTRKLILKAKYWVETIKPGPSAFAQLVKLIKGGESEDALGATSNTRKKDLWQSDPISIRPGALGRFLPLYAPSLRPPRKKSSQNVALPSHTLQR